MSAPRSGVPWGLLALVGLVAAVVAIGLATPVRQGAVGTDTLGPVPGESSGEYRDRAAASLVDVGAERRWALVSFPGALPPAEAAVPLAGAGEGVRVSQVVVTLAQGGDTWTDWVHLPAPPPGAESQKEVLEALLDTALRISAARLQDGTAERDRAARAALLDGCACVRALVVHAAGPALRAVAAHPQVAAVEALPADAVYGSFSVRPG